MGEAELLQIYGSYLSQRGCKAYKIPEGKDETPDLILEMGLTIILNEFKAPELIANPEHAPFVYKFKTTFSKLRRNIAKAASQMETYDPEHQLVWIVTFASVHSQLNWNSFESALNGAIVNPDGSYLVDFRKNPAFVHTLNRVKQPDLFVWLQVNSKNQIFQVSMFLNRNSAHHDTAVTIATDLMSLPVSTFDNGPIIMDI